MVLGLNEAAVQYISAKIIGIVPDYEKYYGINLYTPSPSYYPIECALLNEILFFIGEDILFKSTYFSTDDFKNEIIKFTSKQVFENIQLAFDNILKYEEKIIILNNEILETENAQKHEDELQKYRENIKMSFIDTQNLIIKEFLDSEYTRIKNLEDLENYRRKLCKIESIIGKVDNYTFFEDYYFEKMNELEHKSNILENGGTETALVKQANMVYSLLNKIRNLFSYKKSNN